MITLNDYLYSGDYDFSDFKKLYSGSEERSKEESQ